MPTAKDIAGHIAAVNLEDEKGKVIVKAGQKLQKQTLKNLQQLKPATWPVKVKVTEKIVYLGRSRRRTGSYCQCRNKVRF
jgi:membrane-associated HD superfamily phosphohydrolase